MEPEPKPSQSTESQTQTLPDEILYDILSALPAPNLIQYRSVSKSLCSMISDPQFIRTHLHHSSQSLSRQWVFLKHPYNHQFIFLDLDSSRESKRVDSPWTTSDTNTEVLCSCDGMVLLCFLYNAFCSPSKNKKKDFVLWNPCIRKHMLFSFPYCSVNSCSNELYGLCFDPSTNGYKVIVLFQRYGICVWVFDLKTLCGKMFTESKFSILCKENGVLVNGALHWIVTCNKSCSPVIVYFDLVEEKFKEVPKPDYEGVFDELGLVDLRGWLCVYGSMGQSEVVVWAMKEYGKKESWTKLITIPAKMGSIYLCSVKPLFLRETGEYLVRTDNRELAVYDPKDGAFKTAFSFENGGSLRAVTLVESLVLLNEGDDTTKVRRKKVNPNRRYRNRLKMKL